MVELLPSHTAQSRLFCIPFAGRGATVYSAWPKLFSNDLQLGLVHLPGREGRMTEKPFDRLQPLVDQLVEDLIPHLDRPFSIFGHSLGALIAYDVARRISDRGLSPQHLFVSAQVAPHRLDSGRQLHRLPDAEFIASLQKYYGGIPEKILQQPELMSLFIPILRADLAIIETYQPSASCKLSCPITAFRGSRDEQVPMERFLAWKELTGASFDWHEIDGTHFFVVDSRELVIDKVRQKIDSQ